MEKFKNLSIVIDPKIKKQVEHLFAASGTNVTDAVNLFLKQSILCKGLPFALKPNKAKATTDEQAFDDVKDRN